MGLGFMAYESVGAFLQQCRDKPGCLVADLPMTAEGGAELQDQLRRRGISAPVIFLAQKPPIHLVVQAIKAGAVTVVAKPWDNGQVELAIREGLALDAQRRAARRRRDEFQARLAGLTEKEREVLRMMMAGKANKTMATELGASLRTVENRRRSVFTKLDVHSVAELVAAVLQADEPLNHDGTTVTTSHS